jgi:hypothetical protein
MKDLLPEIIFSDYISRSSRGNNLHILKNVLGEMNKFFIDDYRGDLE